MKKDTSKPETVPQAAAPAVEETKPLDLDVYRNVSGGKLTIYVGGTPHTVLAGKTMRAERSYREDLMRHNGELQRLSE